MRETIPLGSVIYINPNSIGKSFPFNEIEYIDISSVGTGTLTGSTRLSLPDAPSRAKRLVKPGDTILATVRPNLRSFYYVKNPRPNTVVSTGFAVLRAKESIDKRYIYYSVTSQAFTDYLSANVKGAAYPAVDTEIIARGKIYLPSLATQHKIASILSAYDDLIENNLKRIKILEEMAQMIYREWFVNFRFPGHEKVKMVKSELGMIPEGWEVKTLGDVCNIIPGYAFSSKDWQASGIPVIKIKNITTDNNVNIEDVDCISEHIVTPKLRKYQLKSSDFLIAMTGATAGKVGRLRITTSMLLNQRVAKIEPHEDYRTFIWSIISTDEYQDKFFNLADGAAQPNMSGKQIEEVKIILPPLSLCKKYSHNVESIFQIIDVLYFKNSNLRKTRDLLLPKLINGKIDVENMDIRAIV